MDSSKHERVGESISNKSYIKRGENGLRVQGILLFFGWEQVSGTDEM